MTNFIKWFASLPEVRSKKRLISAIPYL